MIKAKVLSFLFLSTIGNLFAQNEYENALSDFLTNQKQEKVYLHFDKPNYGAGETIWFKAYVTDGTYHLPSNISKTLYVELLNSKNEIIDSLSLYVEDGKSKGEIKLKKNTIPGDYRIRAYTNWMRNFDEDFFYRKDFMVVNPRIEGKVAIEKIKESSEILEVIDTAKPVIYGDFLPEGGDLIDGIPTKVAVKMTDDLGRGVKVQGSIVDQKGSEIARFETNELGHDLIMITPKYGHEYSAVGDYEFSLPEVKGFGVSLRVNHNFNSNKALITVLSKHVNLYGGTLVGHQRGEFVFSKIANNAYSFAVKLDKEKVKPGILHLTFFDRNGIPLTERLVYLNIPEQDAHIKITPDAKEYNKRSLVSLSITNDIDSIHSASLTINPKVESGYLPFGEHIVNNLMLTSDLKGFIQSPDYYLQNTEAAYDALDLLMLTQGWSRFNWDSLMLSDGFFPNYFPEDGITIAGQVRDYYNESKPEESMLTLIAPELGMAEVSARTGPNGMFMVGGNQFFDSTMVILKAYGFKKKKDKKDPNVGIDLIYPPRPKSVKPITPDVLLPEEYKTKVSKLNQIDKAFNLDSEAILLDEIVVQTERSIFDDRPKLYSEPDSRLLLDSLGPFVNSISIFDLLGTISGVTVVGNYPFQSVRIRGGNSSFRASTAPLFLLDGMPVNEDLLRDFPMVNIEFIDVLKGARAAAYGSNGGNGVILIFTRRGKVNYKEEKPKGTLVFTHPGYFKAKEFYSPQYDVPREEHRIPDYRSTLFWEPNIEFKDGKSNLEFYTSDQSGSYTIRMEGIKKDGTPFFKESVLYVK